MVLHRQWIALAAVLSGFTAYGQASAPAPVTPVQVKDMRLFQDWLEGRFDNQEQVYFQGQADAETNRKAPRRHLLLAPVPLPISGDKMYYAQRHEDDDPARIGWQGLLTVNAASDGRSIAVDIHEFKRPQGMIDAHLRLESWGAVTAADLIPRPDCTLTFQRQAGQFTASAPKGRACPMPAIDQGGDGPAVILSSDEIWVGGHDQAGQPGISHRLRKARAFSCWMAIRTGDGPRDWQMRRDLTLHDQGGLAWFHTDGRQLQEYGFNIRNVVWPSGPQEDSLALYVRERGLDRAISYAWADPQARRIGINLRQVQGSCSPVADPYRITAFTHR